MKCPECQQAGQASTVTVLGRYSKNKKYFETFDEEGGRHLHDGNHVAQSYECSNGHFWSERLVQKCWCGWTNAPASDREILESLLPAGMPRVPKMVAVDRFSSDGG